MDRIEEFLEDKAKNTQITWRSALKHYFNEIKQDPNTYISGKRDYAEDITKWYKKHLNDPPKSRNTRLSAIKLFLEEFDIDLPKKYWKKLIKMGKGSRALTIDRTPTKNEFKKILQYGNALDKALFLFASSSGMRVSEILKIKLSNIDMDHKPPLVKIPPAITKTGNPRITFITPEAKEYLLLWLEEKEEFVKLAESRTYFEYRGNRDMTRIFPFSHSFIWNRWKNLIIKAKLDETDETTGRYEIHIHSLRKFFLSQLKLSIPVTVAEALGGHQQYLDEAYRRYNREQLTEFYKKGMENLIILEAQPDLSEHNERITQLEKENEQLRKDMQHLMARVLSQDDKTKKN
jgi:integrase